MTFWFRGHHYRTQFRHTLSLFTHWYSIKGFAGALWSGEDYLTWFAHQDDCCDYWKPIDDPEAIRAFMLDDDFQLSKPQADGGGDGNH